MNNAVMFGRATDEWATPQALFDALCAEFEFELDAAATKESAKLPMYYGLDHEIPGRRDALTRHWAADINGLHFERWAIGNRAVWLNPPYSRCREFIAKAAQEAQRGATVVCLVPSRTDTRWWHEHVWDATQHDCRPGVEVRFIKGRLKFGASENSAPFPSVIVIFRPVSA